MTALTPWLVCLFAALVLLSFNNTDRWFRSSYRCGICGTSRPDEHHKDCPWRS